MNKCSCLDDRTVKNVIALNHWISITDHIFVYERRSLLIFLYYVLIVILNYTKFIEQEIYFELQNFLFLEGIIFQEKNVLGYQKQLEKNVVRY